MKINLFIVIVTYNGMKWLHKCLSSCASYHVIVIDNNSSDDTVSFIKEEFPKTTILQQKNNLGFGAANNIGFSYALKQGADYVFLLNQDAYLKPNTVEDLVRCHKDNTDFGILSPIHLNGDGTKLDYNFSKYIALNNALQNDINRQLFSKQIYEIPFVNAAAWLLPRKTIETVGGFDPIFYHYGEDINYTQRNEYHKLRIGVVSQIYVLHDRELRLKRQLDNNSEKLTHFERSLKQNWANINNDIENNIRLKKQIVVKAILKSLIKLKFNEAIININKYRLLNTILPDIRNSRKINKEIGLHYLDD
ncbi:glycosyltransferase family 2 protein [uncultured Algibacter sp.]|uniref:glycosyltransferase family 2 protein n=1 Tax=uncultured Algibacter sp. TaxID=298659 RepID=UPI00260B724B|nr:glycosyltransferase family 2 protein [uncultured Algibacter sp.]